MCFADVKQQEVTKIKKTKHKFKFIMLKGLVLIGALTNVLTPLLTINYKHLFKYAILFSY